MATKKTAAVPTPISDLKPGRMVQVEPRTVVSTFWSDGKVTIGYDDGTTYTGDPTDAVHALPEEG